MRQKLIKSHKKHLNADQKTKEGSLKQMRDMFKALCTEFNEQQKKSSAAFL